MYWKGVLPLECKWRHEAMIDYCAANLNLKIGNWKLSRLHDTAIAVVSNVELKLLEIEWTWVQVKVNTIFLLSSYSSIHLGGSKSFPLGWSAWNLWLLHVKLLCAMYFIRPSNSKTVWNSWSLTALWGQAKTTFNTRLSESTVGFQCLWKQGWLWSLVSFLRVWVFAEGKNLQLTFVSVFANANGR